MDRTKDKSKRTFEWLKDYLDLQQDIRYLNWDIRKSEIELERFTSGDLKNVSLNERSRSSKIEDNIETMRARLSFDEHMITDLKNLVSTFKGIDNQIIVDKYIKGMTLEEIAFNYNRSYDDIKHKHANIIKCLDFLDDYQDKLYSLTQRDDY
ncbi:hypothetical protein [Pediococcus inopinatus]|uniref:hypothetical protein n=1 Tax=Pediococcus inopinatus TaxID=114090 RepID=UPI0007C4E712|nr:hypothetical protein [Pediococcus inopinatus]